MRLLAFSDDNIGDEPFREQEYIPYLLRIQRVPERNQANMFYIELLPTIPDGREIRHRHTKVCRQIFIQVAMGIHVTLQFFFIKHFKIPF